MKRSKNQLPDDGDVAIMKLGPATGSSDDCLGWTSARGTSSACSLATPTRSADDDVTIVTADDVTGATVDMIGWTVIWGTSLCDVVLMAATPERMAVGRTTIVAVCAGV